MPRPGGHRRVVRAEAVAGLTPRPSTVIPIAGTAEPIRDLGGPVNNDKRTEFAIVATGRGGLAEVERAEDPETLEVGAYAFADFGAGR
jgi:hypothetical protein